MIRLAIVAEGATEQGFVRSLLAPHLLGKGVMATAPLLGSGGNVSVDRLAREMVGCAPQFERVTSLVDLYGFGGSHGASAGELERRVDGEIAGRLRRGSNPEHVFTYIQQYEFEALLFSQVEAFARVPSATKEGLRQLRRVAAAPEDIDAGADSAPSKRIKAALPRYDKVADGVRVAKAIGLDRMRDACPRFGRWLTRLESLTGGPPPRSPAA